jgi:hypothetical protein
MPHLDGPSTETAGSTGPAIPSQTLSPAPSFLQSNASGLSSINQTGREVKYVDPLPPSPGVDEITLEDNVHYVFGRADATTSYQIHINMLKDATAEVLGDVTFCGEFCMKDRAKLDLVQAHRVVFNNHASMLDKARIRLRDGAQMVSLFMLGIFHCDDTGFDYVV